jgi:gamma-glutamyltranspeptidase/glutathione hydrolase
MKNRIFTLFVCAWLQACASLSPQPAPLEDYAQSTEIGGGSRYLGADYSRSPVHAANGIAATAHPLASQVAIEILKRGGNAVDAAIAANAALGLMEPTGCGIGGDLFAIVWDPKSGQLHGYNGSGRSPAGQDLTQLKAAISERVAGGKLPEDFKGIPRAGSLGVTVPGTVDGWFALHDRFGNLSMSELMAPTIRYAREGHPLSPMVARGFAANLRSFSRNAAVIEEFDNATQTYFKGGEAPVAGEIFRNPDLADTLETLGRDGRAAFYEGDLARTMAAYFERIGSAMRYEDLANHRGEWVNPASVNYRGYDVYELPPNGQGFAALQMLSILKNVDLTQWSRGSAEVFHYMVEAKRLAYEDAARFYADPDFAEMPLETLLSDEYGRARFALIDPTRASDEFAPGEPLLESPGDTTYLTVADRDGMMVSLIQSNYAGMGSGLVPDGLGFMLQDRGALFSLEPGHPNAYEPGKRPFHTIIPAFVMKDGLPYMSFGLMGGAMQPQGHTQVLVNIIDFAMNLQEAGDTARFYHKGGRQATSIDQDLRGTLWVEPGVPAVTRRRLQDMGHAVEINDQGVMFGGYQAISRDHELGSYTAATEMRSDGHVSAW